MKRRLAQGFTLIEVMVAMVISLVILGGAISVLLQNQRNYRTNDDFGRLQENARFALDLISTDLRMTGFMGCTRNNISNLPSMIHSQLFNVQTGTLLDTAFYIDGWEDLASGTWAASGVTDPDAASIDGFILGGTDAITIRRLRNRGVPITASMTAVDSPIDVTSNPVNVGEIAAIYNCNGTDIFQVINGSTSTRLVHQSGAGTPGNASNNLSMVYTQNPYYLAHIGADPEGNSACTFVAAFDAVRYYISNETDRPSLWRQYYNGATITKQELVEGIENMQILYGVDGTDGLSYDGVPDDYESADAVPNWNNVVAVRITLLVSTVDEAGTEEDNESYDVNGTPADTGDDWQAPGDRRTRKLVSSTVFLRNMQARLTAG